MSDQNEHLGCSALFGDDATAHSLHPMALRESRPLANLCVYLIKESLAARRVETEGLVGINSWWSCHVRLTVTALKKFVEKLSIGTLFY
jgi:hypothetical protein